MKKLLLLCMAFALLALAGGCGGERADEAHGAQLVYATKDYEEINVLVDEYSEIGLLLFDGLMRRDENDAIVPALAESVEYDPETYTYVFHLREGVHWHDGKPLRAADVKFTIEAIKNPLVDSLHAPNFEEVREITEVDDRTVRIRLSAPNAAFLDYMMQPILPAHLLAGQDLITTGFFRRPVGTGSFRMESWEAGKEIVLVKNEDYYRGAPKIDRFVVKIVADDAAEAKALADGSADLARLSPRAAAPFEGRDGYRFYAMKTANFGAILINCAHPYWQRNRDLLPAIAYAVDRAAVINDALLGHGIPAYSPLQRSPFNNPNVEHYDYNPAKAQEILEAAGCRKGSDGYYTRGGEEVGFILTVKNDKYSRIDIANVVAAQMRAVGIHCTVETPAKVDWDGQMAYLSGVGNEIDPDAHTYKVFSTNGRGNDGHYSNPRVDEYLLAARRVTDTAERMRLYGLFQEEVARDLPYIYICYLDFIYVTNTRVHGITPNRMLGYNGVGFFWNVNEWTVD
ncbi:ABC transporter, substrate-binding protein, family 5 [Selenomonas sp. FOBRC6]|uniref:ABC transporter substrate-binding protein n=1 Tax=Selenomonas sp. FOBRC6 TaxID=936572 RepID=UPI000278195D|nr:ABC transporter substrate-binding protein [Selenomonas sp. FOBRC6]EJO23228.1 ABC transporter, substrate-binding protein, family 5 [Selenomonas sp. FOBRC6]